MYGVTDNHTIAAQLSQQPAQPIIANPVPARKHGANFRHRHRITALREQVHHTPAPSGRAASSGFVTGAGGPPRAAEQAAAAAAVAAAAPPRLEVGARDPLTLRVLVPTPPRRTLLELLSEAEKAKLRSSGLAARLGIRGLA